MIEKFSRIAEQMADGLSRRGFLRRGSIAAAGLIGSVFGISRGQASSASATCCLYLCNGKHGTSSFTKKHNGCAGVHCAQTVRHKGETCTLWDSNCIAHSDPC
jgi:hypothetical protein